MYNKRKSGQPYQGELKTLSKELLLAKKKAQETFLLSVLQTESRCWTEFCKYVEHCIGKGENFPAIEDKIGKIFTDPIEKATSLNSYYASLFSCDSYNL
jgi:hypothetical protein